MFANPPTTDVSKPVRRTGIFFRWLHRAYFRSAGIHYSISRRIRPSGFALGIILVLATCLGIGHGSTSVYQLFSLSSAMLGLGLLRAMTRRSSLEAVRELPRYATAGERLRYAVRVHNKGKRNLACAWLLETPPDPRPNIEDFATLKEPGEEERNRFDRTYFRWQWLLLRNRLFIDGSSRDEIRVKPGGQTTVFVEFVPLRRGVIRLRDLRVLLPDAFGLFQRCKKTHARQATVMVLPRRYSLPAIELPGRAMFNISGDTNTNAIGTSGEFVGLRDYRPGDPLRQIHWKSWARTGRPIVKELEDTFYPRYGLILDTLSTGQCDAEFEEAVSVAASFAATLDTSESLLDLMFVKNEAHIVTAGRGVERAEKLLEVLAGVTPERTGDFDQLAELVLHHRDTLTSCLVIFNGWNELRRDFLTKLTRHGVVCVPLIIGYGSRPSGVPGYWLEVGHIARDLKRLPHRLSPEI
jgi:uncharacterized protein (DUF58 family)